MIIAVEKHGKLGEFLSLLCGHPVLQNTRLQPSLQLFRK